MFTVLPYPQFQANRPIIIQLHVVPINIFVRLQAPTLGFTQLMYIISPDKLNCLCLL